MDAGLRRAEWDAERGRRLWQRQVEVVAEDDEGPFLGPEVHESSCQLVAIDDRRLGAGDRARVEIDEGESTL